MSKKYWSLLFILVANIAISEETVTATAQNPLVNEAEPAAEPEIDVAKISENFGHLIARSFQKACFQVNLPLVLKGIEDHAQGKEPPMTEWEWVCAISSLEEAVRKAKMKKQLEEAITFLANKQSEKNVISLEEGKVLYTVDKEGAGEAITATSTPLVRYTATLLDNNGVDAEGMEEDKISVAMDELMSGLRVAMLGMKEGEQRTIHIHPDLAVGYGSLVTFVVQVLQANSSEEGEKNHQEDESLHEPISLDPEIVMDQV